MKKEVIHFNETSYNKAVRETENFIKGANEVLELHRGLGSPFEMSKEAIMEILINGAHAYKKAFCEALTPPEIKPGFRMKKEAFLESVDFPDMSAFDTFKDMSHIYRIETSNRFALLKGDKAVVDEAALELHKEAHTMYADTPAKLSALNAHRNLGKAIQEFNDACRKIGLLGITKHSQPVASDLFYISEEGRVSLRTEYFVGKGELAEVSL